MDSDVPARGPRRLRRPGVIVPAGVILVLLLMAVSPSLWGAGDPFDCSLDRSLWGPRAGHPFGFDLQGCDYYTRVLYGARSSLTVAVLVVSLTGLIGVILGSIVGLRGGWLDAVVGQIADVVLAVPLILAAALVLTFFEDRGELQVVFGLVVLSWPTMTRQVRGEVRRLRAHAYVESARALGANDLRILRTHILPNAMWPLLVYAAGFTALAIAAEAILSFLGIGLDLPAISWGLMLAQVRYRVLDHPHLLIPALFLSLTVAAFVFLAEALQRASAQDDGS